MNFKSFLLLILTSLLLAGCTLDAERPTDVQHISQDDPSWQQHLATLKQIKQYQAVGQIGYISSKERFSSRFNWRYENPQFYTLKLYSVVSASSLLIQMRPTGMTISDNKGNQRSEADAKMLLRDIIGMEIPLEQFAFWLKGQPTENANYQVGLNHLLADFSYPVEGSIWTADYLSYHIENSMPENILLKNATTSQTLKIRVDSWKY